MEMSITRALSEKKMLTKRLGDKIDSGIYVGVVVGNTNKPEDPRFSVAKELDSAMKSSYDSVEGLLARYRAITKAIIHSNSSTVIDIGGEEMTVAEAIERKKSISFEMAMLEQLKKQYVAVGNKITSANNSMQYEIDELIKSRGDKSTKDEDYVKSIDESRRAILEYKMFDPYKINEQIDNYCDSIENFNNEIDFVLSESNAKTMITIDD